MLLLEMKCNMLIAEFYTCSEVYFFSAKLAVSSCFLSIYYLRFQIYRTDIRMVSTLETFQYRILCFPVGLILYSACTLVSDLRLVLKNQSREEVRRLQAVATQLLHFMFLSEQLRGECALQRVKSKTNTDSHRRA